MPRISKSVLIENVVRALSNRGWRVDRETGPAEHPAKLRLRRERVEARVRVFIWNLSHGGGSRSADEYRIQVTSGVEAFSPEDGYETVILGWSDQFGVFAGFDANRRLNRLGSSPSIQVSRHTIDRSLDDGIAKQTKAQGEIAVSVRPDRLGEYLTDVRQVHRGDLSSVLSPQKTLEQNLLFLEAESQAQRDFRFGSAAEQAQRRLIAGRLDDLERMIGEIRADSPGRGHNNPPELIENEEQSTPHQVKLAADEIRRDLESREPEAARVAANSVRVGWLSNFIKGTLNSAAQKVQEQIGSIIAGGTMLTIANAPALLNVVGQFLDAVVRWFQLLT